jgi:hypothetical protein
VSTDPWQPPGATANWAAPVPQPHVRFDWPHEVRAGFVTAAVLVLLGAPLGLLWSHLTPHTALLRFALSDGSHVWTTVGPAEGVVRADVLFFLITVLAGIACGAGAWLVARRAGPGVAVGLLVGGIGGALIAQRVGRRVITDGIDAVIERRYGVRPPNSIDVMPPTLAHGVLLAWSLGALVTFFALALFLDLRGPSRRTTSVS